MTESNFQKVQAKHNKQLLNFAKTHFEEINNGKDGYLDYLKILIYSGITTRKILRKVLFQAVEFGEVETSLFFVKLLDRELTYSEKSKLAKESENSFEFCEDYFPERIAEIAARGTKKAAIIAQQNSIRSGGHKLRHNGNIV